MLAGRLMDKVGTKAGYALAIVLEPGGDRARGRAPLYRSGDPSSAARRDRFRVRHADAPVAGFSLARFALGLGEARQLPGGDQGVAEWFPKKERALATGIFNSGTNVGAMVTPLVVPWITVR